MRTKISLMFPLICAPLAFWGCGDDTTSAKANENAETGADSDIVVGTYDDLPVCSGKRDGAIAYVKDENTAYICEDGKWVEDDEESGDGVDSDAKSSSCKKGGSSSGGKTSSSSSSSKYEQDDSAYDQPEVVKVKDKSIAGVSQKGPFVTGSAVKLYELDGETYAQTGKSFTGKISSDKGEFSVSSVTLASQYALLEANGYFRNEVTGKKSSGTITLNALTDLSDREKVNINLLTHLEYERALYLVGTGINVPAAKKQAEAEVFNAFGIQDDFANFEDLNIFSKGDGNAALLAFSVLMQGDRSEAELTELLTKFATDIEKDGEWNDETTKAKIADWAMNKDLKGGLESIRSNINGWNLGTAPDFEKHVRNFWYTNYGLGTCDDDSKGALKAVANERSENYGSTDRYICKSGAWVYASDIEKDTYEWAAGDDGEIKKGNVISSNKYVYDGKLKAWRKATFVEGALGGCTEAIAEDIVKNTGKVNGTWYICKNREWKSTNNITVDAQGWVEGSDGSLEEGDKNSGVWYKYDESLDKWIDADSYDAELGLQGCTVNRSGEIGKSSETYYVCKNSRWQKAEEIDYDTYGKKCTSAEVGAFTNGVVTETNKYYCTANGWVSLVGGWSWDVPKEARLNPEVKYGTMKDERDGQTYKTVTIGTQTWMAENLNYADSVKTTSLKGKSWCYDNDPKKCAVAGRLYTWAAAIDSVALASERYTCGYNKNCNRLTADALAANPIQGICPSGWHLPSNAEWRTLFYSEEIGGIDYAGTKLKSTNAWYSGDGEDSFGFAVLPAGYRDSDGDFIDAGDLADFWSSTEDDSSFAYSWPFRYDSTYVSYSDDKYYGFSVRCLRD